MQFNPNEIVQLFVGIQSLLFAFILLTDRGKKRRVNYFLAAFLMMLACQMLLILSEKWLEDFSFLSHFLCLFGFAYGPLLYFYTLHMVFRDHELRPKHLWHALPFSIIFISSLLGYGLCFKFGSMLYISLLIYVVLSIRQILAYRQVVKNTRSALDKINLSWLQWTLIIFTITLLVDIYSHFYEEIEPIPGISIVNVSLLILINGVFYKGLRQPEIFQGISKEDQPLAKKSGSDPAAFEKEATKLCTYFEEHHAFRDPDLTLAQLAEALDMPVRRLSEVINRYFEQNFMDFVNSHRIAYAQQRLRAPKEAKETIAEVMYDAGFNSKSSFNTLFKQRTGKTPSEFKKAHSA